MPSGRSAAPGRAAGVLLGNRKLWAPWGANWDDGNYLESGRGNVASSPNPEDVSNLIFLQGLWIRIPQLTRSVLLPRLHFPRRPGDLTPFHFSWPPGNRRKRIFALLLDAP